MSTLRRQYEREVRALAQRGAALRTAGADSETIARVLHAARRDISVRYKAATPDALREELIARTVAVYGNPHGPTLDSLRAAGQSWEEIAEAAARPGPFPPRGRSGV